MSYLFIGVGNAQRGDDAAGAYVAQKLQDNQDFLEKKVDVLAQDGEGATLMFEMEGKDKVVIVDAMKSNRPLGTVERFDVGKQKIQTGVFRYSSHLFGLAEAVEMARQLGKLPKELIIYGIEGHHYEFGEPLSPEVEEAALKVVDLVVQEFAA